MLKALEKNGDQYFTYMTGRGWKLQHDFDFQSIIQKREPIENEISRNKVEDL